MNRAAGPFEIIEILGMMPDAFKKSDGGGATFLNLCLDKDGNHWGEHPTIDQMIALGLAIGKVSFPMPREMWSSLPGGMPFVAIDL